MRRPNVLLWMKQQVLGGALGALLRVYRDITSVLEPSPLQAYNVKM